MAKIEILTFVGAVFPHFCHDKREIWYWGAVHSPVPNFTFIGATCRPCGAKNIFGLLSKNSADMSAGNYGIIA